MLQAWRDLSTADFGMTVIEPVSLYFGAERAESLLFICVGLVGLELAWTCWRKGMTGQARGAAVALTLLAAIQLLVGGTVFVRSPHDQARVSQALQSDVQQVRTQELPRMRTVMRNFRVYRWVEIAAVFLGALMALAGRRGSMTRGVGLVLLPQALVLLVFDGLAEERGASYLAWLQRL